MSESIAYSIVIPAYNESDKITSSLTQVVNFMRSYATSFEIIVVDDGSSDNTAALVETYSKTNPEVKIIRNKHKGKGPTVWTGIMAAQGDLVYMCDADLSAPISELKKLAFWITEHEYDIVIASREGAGAVRIKEPFYRHFIGRGFNILVQLFALPGIKDTQCGFKLFKKDVAKNIFKMLHIYGQDAAEIKDAYMGAFDVEVLYLAKKKKYKIKELPVVWTHVPTNRLNTIRDSFKMLKDVLAVRVNDWKGVYK